MLALQDVTETNYRSIPSPCGYCLYWQKAGPFTEDMVNPEMEQEKLAWWCNVTAEFGTCHKIAIVDDTPVGFIQYAPARYFPRVDTYAPLAPSQDALFIACLYLKKESRGRGIGILMLEELIAALRKSGCGAIETLARENSTDNPSGPVDLYLKQGFGVKGKNEDWALLRLEL